jgi:SpoVK/Ycf46/Vps4 family AAA+-type ATPase
MFGECDSALCADDIATNPSHALTRKFELASRSSPSVLHIPNIQDWLSVDSGERSQEEHGSFNFLASPGGGYQGNNHHGTTSGGGGGATAVGGMSQYCDLLLSLLKELPESSPVLVLCTANVQHMHQLPQSLLEAITLQPEGEQGLLNITDLVAFKGYCELGEPNDAARGAFFESSLITIIVFF